MTVDNSGTLTKSTIELSAPLIQLNDFEVGDWSPEKSASEKPVSGEDKKNITIYIPIRLHKKVKRLGNEKIGEMIEKEPI